MVSKSCTMLSIMCLLISITAASTTGAPTSPPSSSPSGPSTWLPWRTTGGLLGRWRNNPVVQGFLDAVKDPNSYPSSTLALRSAQAASRSARPLFNALVSPPPPSVKVTDGPYMSWLKTSLLAASQALSVSNTAGTVVEPFPGSDQDPRVQAYNQKAAAANTLVPAPNGALPDAQVATLTEMPTLLNGASGQQQQTPQLTNPIITQPVSGFSNQVPNPDPTLGMGSMDGGDPLPKFNPGGAFRSSAPLGVYGAPRSAVTAKMPSTTLPDLPATALRRRVRGGSGLAPGEAMATDQQLPADADVLTVSNVREDAAVTHTRSITYRPPAPPVAASNDPGPVYRVAG